MLDTLVDKVGSSRIVLGSDYPVGEEDPIGFVMNNKKISMKEKEDILQNNAANMLGIVDLSTREGGTNMATVIAPQKGRREAATAERLMKNARDLVPVLAKRAQETSRNRSVPKETIDDFWKADLFDVIKPKKFGGKEIRYDDYIDLGIELARGDGSAAWVYTVIVVHELIIALFDEQAQKDVWEQPRALCASSFAPSGKMDAAPGGARVSGKWSFCSGIDNCDWMVFGAFAGMTGTPPHPDLRFFLIPKREGQVIDDWNVMGLQGTGSKSYRAQQRVHPRAPHHLLGGVRDGRGAVRAEPGRSRASRRTRASTSTRRRCGRCSRSA